VDFDEREKNCCFLGGKFEVCVVTLSSISYNLKTVASESDSPVVLGKKQDRNYFDPNAF